MIRFLRVVVTTLVIWGAGSMAVAAVQADGQEPLIPDLRALREALSGEDAEFVAAVEEGTTGTVRFVLKTYAGRTVWGKTAPIADGRATVVLGREELDRLEKGSRVLVATVNHRADQRAYTPVRLRGRIFREVTKAPAEMRPGDEIVTTDMSLLRPQATISEKSERGKWWHRGYTVPGNDEEQFLVCVEERDMEDPESCIAPQLALPLDLEGWYEVWVRTYRQHVAGGVDVRLSGEKYFFHCDPLEIATVEGMAHPPFDALVDVFYRASDLSGQDLVFQQPYGTYDSVHKLCTAALAGVRLVKLSDDQVARLQAERARQDTKVIVAHDDGYSSFWARATNSRDTIARLLEPLRDQSTAFLNFELSGGVGCIYIPTPYTGLFLGLPGYTRDGDYRVSGFYRWCEENEVNILRVLTDYAEEVGLKVVVTMMMGRIEGEDEFTRAHPEWRCKKGTKTGIGVYDYALPEVHDFQIKKIAWIIENHDIAGFVVDFTRYGYFFNVDDPDKFEPMNAFLRKLRAAVDAVNARRPRKCLLCASFGERSYDLLHWGTGELADQGLDVKTWLDEGIFDIILPQGPTALDFVEMAKNSRTEVWPRKLRHVTLKGHKFAGGDLGPKQIEKEVKWAFDQGARGLYFFNHSPWSTLRRLGFKEELGLRTRVEEIYGYREGPLVNFTTWYPNLDERNAQRATFKPLTIPVDDNQNVDGELAVPVRNTFARPVTAVVGWPTPPDQDAEQWRISPESSSIEIAAGEEGTVSFRLTGTAQSYQAVPRGHVEMRAEERVVLRHNVPLRAVRQMVCRKVSTAPVTDGELSEPVWAGPGGLQPVVLQLVGQSEAAPLQVRAAVSYDDENLYVAYECQGLDVSGIERDPAERDSQQVYDGDHLQILVDPIGTEQMYMGFVVTPAGAQADFRSSYVAFTGHFERNRGWNRDWTASAAWREDGYAVEAAIPFASLDATPKPGDVWRLNVVTKASISGGESVTACWASPEAPFHLPRHFGTLHGTLVFE